MKWPARGQTGFTLLELSIVLLVITLFMGVVLQSRNVVEQARIKRLALDVEAVSGAMRVYVEKYHAQPGDDPLAARRWPDSRNGNGDGVVEGEEMKWFWRHLRLAGLYVDPDRQMEVACGVMGFSGLALCFVGLPTERMRLYDLEFDDGIATSGRVRWGEVACASLGGG